MGNKYDGTMVTIDSDGKEDKITDKDNFLFGDMDKNEIVNKGEKKSIIICVVLVLGVVIVAITGFVCRKKMRKK